MGLVGDVLPGGRQAEKTFQGLDTALRGGRYNGYGENAKLMYPVSEDPMTALRAALFGNSALEETGAYYASGEKALSEKQTRLYKEMASAGGNEQEIYHAILNWRRLQADEELTGGEKARLGEEIVSSVELGDRSKLAFYRGLTGADSRADKLETLLDAGMDWDGAIGAYARYDEINRREGLDAAGKATEFARWADENYPAGQARAAKEQFKYYTMTPAQAGQYEKLTGAGLETDDAYRVAQALAGLEPEEGKKSVSNLQKYRAIVSMGISQSEQLEALEGIAPEAEFRKISVGSQFGVVPEQYIAVKEALAGTGDNGTPSQKEAKKTIQNMAGLTTEQKAVLWQVQNKSWSSSNNPFSTRTGRQVREALNEEVEGLSLPEIGDTEGADTPQITPWGLSLPGLEG